MGVNFLGQETGDDWRKNSIFQHFLAHLIYYFDVNVLRSGHSSVCYCVIQPRGESRVKSILLCSSKNTILQSLATITQTMHQ